jgi:hypothetical protein
MGYRWCMGLYNAAKMFRERADIYLEMIRYVRDERQRQILHKLAEDNKAKADLFENKSAAVNIPMRTDGTGHIH